MKMRGFKDFVEAAKPASPGFSFASLRQDRRRSPGATPSYNRGSQIAQSAAYQQAIERGHQSERDISAGLQTSCGFTLMANQNQLLDMRQAIDTFLIQGSEKIPVQIKARKWGTKASGGLANDVGYEVAKDFNATDPTSPPDPEVMLQRLNGRDMRGIAKLTVVLAQEGDRIYIIDTNEGHEIIEQAVQQWSNLLHKFDATPRVKARYSNRYPGNGIELVRKFDTRDNYWKIMAYIQPQAFKSLKICGLQKPIDTRF